MSPLGAVRSHWRLGLLVLFVLGSITALFVPGGIVADDSVAGDSEDSMTNLQFGLGLDGGTQLKAPVVGMTAENLDLEQDEGDELESDLRESLDLEAADVMVRYHDDGSATVEVFSDDVSEGEFQRALEDAGQDVDDDDIDNEVTDETRNEVLETVQDKINEAGLEGGTAYEAEGLDRHYIVVEVPGMTSQELEDLLSDRGVVEVVAHHPSDDDDGNQTNETVLTQENIDTVSPPEYNEEQGHYVSVTVSSDHADEFEGSLRDAGFGQNPMACEGEESLGESGQYCLMTVVDDEVIDARGINTDLATSIEEGSWSRDPSYVMPAEDQDEAQSLSINLRAGSLRAPLDFDDSQSRTIQPALAEQFKTYSLFIGLLSVVTVSGVVYLRYSDVRVAAPMILTALAEVIILLGFAAVIRMPIDLSHVAGFIAVVGTGVDDLVIIADEVMDEGDVNSQRVFSSRFRKAFWVIGAAAATTIVALSPLAVLSLGDLQGFAIITILGVLIGVFITRPAYGDILRRLLTGEK
ncbi:preprotein translocase subunit SecD [Natrialbaceae archaeon GCM10025810]|uniref:preprotein translocase subunit SecD n=1 Tax=Halovalidus salilacus TaxID=3075124 RepID=UPI0036191084